MSLHDTCDGILVCRIIRVFPGTRLRPGIRICRGVRISPGMRLRPGISFPPACSGHCKGTLPGASEAYRNKDYETAAKHVLDIVCAAEQRQCCILRRILVLWSEKARRARNISLVSVPSSFPLRERLILRGIFSNRLMPTSSKIRKIRHSRSYRHQLCTSLTWSRSIKTSWWQTSLRQRPDAASWI